MDCKSPLYKNFMIVTIERLFGNDPQISNIVRQSTKRGIFYLALSFSGIRWKPKYMATQVLLLVIKAKLNIRGVAKFFWKGT